MRPVRSTPVVLLLGIVGLTACGPSESGPGQEPEIEPATPQVGAEATTIPDPFAYTEALLVRRDVLQRTEGELVMGDASATFVAFLEDDEPVLVEESVSLGDYGHQENRYVLASGRLVLYESSATRTITDPARPPGNEAVEVVLTFDADGSPRFTAMTVDGHSVEMEESLIRGALARTTTLRRAALETVARSSGD